MHSLFLVSGIPSFKIFITTVEAAEIVYKKIQEELTKDERNLRISIVAICPDGSKVQFNSDKEINVTHEFIADVMSMDGVEVSEKTHTKVAQIIHSISFYLCLSLKNSTQYKQFFYINSLNKHLAIIYHRITK